MPDPNDWPRPTRFAAPAMLWATLLFSPAWSASPASPPRIGTAAEQQRIEVGPNRNVKTIGAAAILAKDGALIEVDAGDYRGDVAVWTQNDLSLRAIGGRVRLIADGRSVEDKAIWVVRAERMTVEGFDFSGAAVRDRNGAGIRMERGSLRVRDCSFTHNENGILTGNQPNAVLEIEDSEFGYNGAGDGLSHNLYVGSIARLSVTGSYFHHAAKGHLLKSRAAINHVSYNRLTDEIDGTASYELEFPNGGVAYVIGNIIQQSALTDNSHLISVGAEGYRWPENALYLINNTLIDNLPQGRRVLTRQPGRNPGPRDQRSARWQWHLEHRCGCHLPQQPDGWGGDFANLTAGDFRLTAGARARGRAADSGSAADGTALRPVREYRHPRHTAALEAPPVQPGAVQTLAQSLDAFRGPRGIRSRFGYPNFQRAACGRSCLRIARQRRLGGLDGSRHHVCGHLSPALGHEHSNVERR
jgi:hypothetical protein